MGQALKGITFEGNPQQFTWNGSPVALTAGTGYYMIQDITTAAKLAELGAGEVMNPVVMFATPGSNALRVKADKPQVEKKIDGDHDSDETSTGLVDYDTASIGQTVPYVITAHVPAMELYDKYYMEFADTLSQGLTLVATDDATNKIYKGIKVTIDNVTLDNTQYTVTVTPETKDLTKQETTSIKVVITDLKALVTNVDGIDVGDTITVSYSATVNKNAVVGEAGNDNKVKIIYSNNPDKSGDGEYDSNDWTSETPEDKVTTYVTRLKVHKQDGKTSEALAGAVFTLKGTMVKDTLISGTRFVEDASGEYYKITSGDKAGEYTTDTNATGVDTSKKYKKENFTNELVSGTADSSSPVQYSVEAVSDASGNLTFTGLGRGTYTFTEIQAPYGYNKLTSPITITITPTYANTDYDGTQTVTWSASASISSGDAPTVSWDSTEKALVFTVNNNSGSTLPETGGMGTTLLYVGGSILVVLAAILLITKRRMSSED